MLMIRNFSTIKKLVINGVYAYNWKLDSVTLGIYYLYRNIVIHNNYFVLFSYIDLFFNVFIYTSISILYVNF